MAYPTHLLPTTVVGSYPQPGWLVDRDALRHRRVPRVHAPELWRISAAFLEEAQDDATLVAIRDMERAGIDVVTDGEIRRESYSNRFALSLDGIDADRPATIAGRNGPTLVPRIVGPIRRRGAVEVRDAAFLRRASDRATKITLPGPFTLAQQAFDEFYGDDEAVAMAYAAAVNEELREIVAAGVDVVQLDEPWMEARADRAARYGVRALNRALEGIDVPTVAHVCFGYAEMVADKPAAYTILPALADCTARQISIEAAQPKIDLGVLADLSSKTIMLGVLDLSTPDAETEDEVARRLRRALTFVEADRLVAAPDCGMKYLPRDLAFAKLVALAAGAAIVRYELQGMGVRG
jgi:5-methyltetrahydropteroyltriglutamate--homocysteine methyltransferase